jgi:hypothetical protein
MPFDGQTNVTTIRTPEVVKVTKVEPAKPVMPTFPPRRDRSRLDLRPVIWSLYNQPEDWRLDEYKRLVHLPTHHKFKANSLFFCGKIVAAPCNCGTILRRGTFRDRLAMRRAFKVWKRDYHFAAIQKHFAGHFVH